MVFLLVLVPVTVYAVEPVGLPFEEAYRMALESNHDIRTARESVEQGVLLEKQAITVLFPNLTAVAGYSWESYADGTDGDGTSWGLNLTQTIYNGGRVWVAKRGAQYTKKAAELGLDFARQSVLMELVVRANQYLSAEDLYSVAKKQVERVSEQLRLAETRLELGDVPRTSVLTAQVALSSAQLEVVGAQQEVALAARRLATLIGSERNVRIRVPRINASPEKTPLEDLIAVSIEERADLAQARELVKIAREEAELVSRSDNVNVDLSGSYMKYSDDDTYLPEGQVAVTLTWPFFQGGLVGLQAKEALSRVRQAEEAYGKQLESARLEVEEAVLNLETLDAKRSLVQTNLINARENRRLAGARFELGAAVDLDLLRAEEDLADAENQEVNHRYETETARAALLFAIGGLKPEVFNQN
jgi:outer membrane protein